MGRVGDNPSMCCLSSSRLPGPGLLRDLSLFRSAFSSPGHDTSRVRGSAGAMPRDKDAVWNYFSQYIVETDDGKGGKKTQVRVKCNNTGGEGELCTFD